MHLRSECPVACTLDLIGDKWTMLVIRDLMLGKRHFKEFRESPEGIASNILSDRLSKLLDNELVEKYPSDIHLGRDAYRLTKKGKSLKPVLNAMLNWGLTNVDGTEAKLLGTKR